MFIPKKGIIRSFPFTTVTTVPSHMCVCVPAILMHLKSNYGMLGTHTPAISWGQVVQGY